MYFGKILSFKGFSKGKELAANWVCLIFALGPQHMMNQNSLKEGPFQFSYSWLTAYPSLDSSKGVQGARAIGKGKGKSEATQLCSIAS
jgi:hypothetical protein